MADDRTESAGAGFLVGILVGTLLGAAAATLLAPQPGAETREALAERSRKLRQRMERMASEMQEGLGEITTRVKGKERGPESASGQTTAAPEEPGTNS